MIADALDQLERIETLEARAAELRSELKRSLMIKEIWPEAFKQGSVTTQATGNPHSVITWTITAGNGDLHEMDLANVPVELWPAQVINDIKNAAYPRGKYNRILRKATKDQTS